LKTRILFLLFSIAFSLPCLLLCQESGYRSLAKAAENLTKQNIVYDPAYFRINYPDGDVPAGKGVCTDLVIRAYRVLGIDLQQLVHEDMTTRFSAYPKNWGLNKPDSNIDHRRVPNLMAFFKHHGTTKKISQNPEDYAPGDIVCWNLGGGITHIGIVSGRMNKAGTHYEIVHNIGAGQVFKDMLFSFKIIGHYAYMPKAP